MTPFRLSRLHRLAPWQRTARLPVDAIVELAWDGLRVMACRVDGVVRLFSEDLREWTEAFPALVTALRALPTKRFVLEGFVCAFDGARPSFERLQAHVAGRARPRLMLACSDLWHHAGDDLREEPPRARRDAMARMLRDAREPLALSGEGTVESLRAMAATLGAPGVLGRATNGLFLLANDAWTKQPLSPPAAVTNADKVMYPRDGLSKRDAFAYYRDIAPVLLPYLRDRPVVAQRWPDGIDEFTWYQHRLPPKAPDYLRSIAIAPRERRFVIDDVEGLLWMVNQAALTFHGWMSRTGALGEPDWLMLDLDPPEGMSFDGVVAVARAVHTLLELLHLPSVPKTSGQKGLHVLVPLAKGHGAPAVHAFAEKLATAVARTLPGQVTLEQAREARRGRIYLDYVQGFAGKSLVLPYSLRAADRAPVSTPLGWDEVRPGLDPRAFTLRTIRHRLDRLGDLAAPLLSSGVELDRVRLP
jgi:bifunctional non-homologous end joining protein LigD